MAIVYPLTAPAEFARAQRFSPRLNTNAAVSPSIFTFAEQRFLWPGQRWEVDMDIAPSLRDKGGVVEGFIASLRGQYGTFLMSPLHALVPRGTVSLSGVTLGASATKGARTLTLAGMGNTKTLLRGDFIQIGTGVDSRLYILTEDITSNSGGAGTVSIEPALRANASSGASVVTNQPKGVWRLGMNAIGPSISPGFVYDSLNIQCVEPL
jgi:hypothetical protein